jgi:hypothetical protein
LSGEKAVADARKARARIVNFMFGINGGINCERVLFVKSTDRDFEKLETPGVKLVRL